MLRKFFNKFKETEYSFIIGKTYTNWKIIKVITFT